MAKNPARAILNGKIQSRNFRVERGPADNAPAQRLSNGPKEPVRFRPGSDEVDDRAKRRGDPIALSFLHFGLR
jgi:hypothetical protein